MGSAEDTSPAGGLDLDATALDALLDLDHPRKLAARRWAEESLQIADGSFDREAWRRCASAGLLGITVDPAHGGAGRSTVEALLTFEGLGLGCPDTGFVFALAAQAFATQRLLVEGGSPRQLERWLPSFVTGEVIGSFAMTEPDHGSDTASITTTATATDGGGYVLDGTKTWVTLGPVADVVIVFATTAPGRGRWGLTAFLVETDRAGVTVGDPIEKMGLTSSPFGQMTFENCLVTEADRIGPEGAGGGLFAAAVEAERAFLYASQLGATERAIAQSIDRASTRRQFDRPIGGFQAVSHRIADMKLRHETARLLVYKAAALHDRGDSVTMAAALAKIQTSETAIDVALDNVRNHGAEGYTTALGVEAELRNAVGGLAYSGTSDIQREVVSRLLGVGRVTRGKRSTNHAGENIT